MRLKAVGKVVKKNLLDIAGRRGYGAGNRGGSDEHA